MTTGDPLEAMAAAATAATTTDADRRAAEVRELADRFAEQVQALGADWLDAPPTPREWLVTFADDEDDDDAPRHPADERDDDAKLRRRRGLLARRELHVLAGEGGAGKGRLATQLALAVAASHEGRTGPFASRLGLDVHPSSGKVLLLVGEDDAHEIQTRAFGAHRAERYTADDANALEAIRERVRWRTFRGEPFALVETGADRRSAVETTDLETLRAYLEAEGPWALVVIDPLARFVGLDENDNAAMHKAAALVEQLCKVSGEPAVLVVAHTRKPTKGENLSQHDVRGASSVVNAARLVAMMAPHTREATVTGDGIEASEGSANARTISEVGARLVVVKNNLSRKGRERALMFHADGGLLVETPDEAKNRRARQYGRGRPVEVKPNKDSSGTVKKPAPGF